MFNLAFLFSINFLYNIDESKHYTVFHIILNKTIILHVIIHMSCKIKLDLALRSEFPYAKSHDNPPPLHSW